MTYLTGGHVFFGARLTSIAALAMLLVGCASATIEDAVPSGANGPANTGTYPNLNIPPQSAAEQISAEKKAADLAALNAEQQQNAAFGAAPSGQTDPALLRRLGQTHGTNALKQIEKTP
ncbi:hypothetical protein GA830_13135 [Mesorhizobium sp. NBSH29]|uniref:hypothetical protein n=1 Tax=Mesorhizobium sp. NBSH29 TaxID=2654249 RepID=UPI00189659AD|nr:hypothetical protein [Mesorhizobium sp. NBSH29]QPC87586.1 hypothetical protein GA830_13135 [Mesorhizobium sp. NBSH29]